MPDRETTIARVVAAFAANEYPGDAYLQGSREGCEPYDEVGPFVGRTDWQALDAAFLDERAAALSFLSEAGFRFFLPAYLVADVRGELSTADPLFHLTHGFHDWSVEVPAGGRTFVRAHGRSALVNPRRYGAMTALDYARFRLSVFSREEAGAVVAYLEHKREADEDGLDAEPINAALDSFWRERARSAPEAAALARHVREEREFAEAIRGRDQG